MKCYSLLLKKEIRKYTNEDYLVLRNRNTLLNCLLNNSFLIMQTLNLHYFQQFNCKMSKNRHSLRLLHISFDLKYSHRLL